MPGNPGHHQTAKMIVCHSGSVHCLKGETKFRSASNIKRGKIAKAVCKGISQGYYGQFRTTPLPELLGGNLSKSLSKTSLNVIASEFKKSKQLHENVFFELQLTLNTFKLTCLKGF